MLPTPLAPCDYCFVRESSLRHHDHPACLLYFWHMDLWQVIKRMGFLALFFDSRLTGFGRMTIQRTVAASSIDRPLQFDSLCILRRPLDA